MEDIKSIKLSLPYVTEDGKSTLREMTVSFKKVIEIEKAGYNNDYSPTYKMGMSLVIPDHIHKRLLGSTVGRKTGLGDSDAKQYATDFSKTVTSDSLLALTATYRNIIYDYKWLIRLDTMEVTKVIFYTFDGKNNENNNSYWDGKKMGSDAAVSYSYMIGFISKEGKTRLNMDKKIFTKQDGQQINWDYVEHTQERELFFKTIFSKFKDLLSQLTDFKKKINSKSIDAMIHSGIKLLN